MSVFYGRNGAGKSTIIDAIRCALTGIRSDIPVELYVRLPTQTFEDSEYPVLPMQTKVGAIEAEWGWDDLYSAAEYDWSTRCDANRELAVAAVRSQRLAVIPTGNSASPQWEIWLAADPGRPEMRPWVEQSKARLSESVARFQEWGDDDDEAMERHQEALWSLAQDPLFSLAWTRPPDSFGHRWEYLEEMRDRWEDWGFPTGPVDGLPIPVARLAATDRLVWPRPLFEVDEGVLQSMLDHARVRTPYGDVNKSEESIAQKTERIVADAQSFYPLMLVDCPRLEVRDASFATWRSNRVESWLAHNDGPPLRPPSKLSAAEDRWARFAAMLATGLEGPPLVDFTGKQMEWPESISKDAARVLILDEPELHLHRSAERHMAEGLRTLSEEKVDYLFVATHAPDLLNLPTAHVYWVANGTVKEFSGASLQDLDHIGLRPAIFSASPG